MTKISELPAATLPLTGTETMPVVQGGVTKKVALVDIDTDPLEMTALSTVPPAPPSGVSLYAVAKANRTRPNWIGPSGVDTGVQSLIAANKVALWSAGGNSTTGFNNASAPGLVLVNFGHTATGAASRSVATTNLFTSTRRLGFVCPSGLGSQAGTRHNIAQFNFVTGFEYIARFGVSSFGSGSGGNFFIGFTSDANVAFTGNTTSAGQGFGLFYSRNTSTGTFTTQFTMFDGGGGIANTPVENPFTTANADLMELRFHIPTQIDDQLPEVYARLENLSTGQVIIDTRLSYVNVFAGNGDPIAWSKTMLMGPHVTTWNGLGNGTGFALDLVSQYIETDI